MPRTHAWTFRLLICERIFDSETIEELVFESEVSSATLIRWKYQFLVRRDSKLQSA